MSNHQNYINQLTDSEKRKPLVLAFDIETDGAFSNKNNILQIGASIITAYPRRKQIDVFLMSEYRKLESDKHNIEQFERRCWDQFWSKNLATLDNIADHTKECSAGRSVEENRKEMIYQFCCFVKKWETICEENEIKLFRTTDNKAFDPFFINVYIEKYLQSSPVFPYKISSGKYGNLFETHSMQWGLLLGLFGSEFVDKTGGFTKAIEQKFKILPGEESIVHDHRADHDAYSIAEELQIMLAIARGEIMKSSQ